MISRDGYLRVNMGIAESKSFISAYFSEKATFHPLLGDRLHTPEGYIPVVDIPIDHRVGVDLLKMEGWWWSTPNTGYWNIT